MGSYFEEQCDEDYVVFQRLSLNSVVEIVFMKDIGDVVFIVDDLVNVPGLARVIEVSPHRGHIEVIEVENSSHFGSNSL